MSAPKILLITHAQRYGGYNPHHTAQGYARLRLIAQTVYDISPVWERFFCGTGTRFQNIREALHAAGVRANEHMYHALLGTEAGLDKGANGEYVIPLTGDTVIKYPSQYYSPPVQIFDPWALLEDQPDKTIICTGGELLSALTGQQKKGALLEVNLRERAMVDLLD